ncbi:mitotic-spindle organizing protein 2A [Trichonephila clavipes]|nr:mitotic-spindle organizing protein 2A [Trichonephila clavipes]
MACERKLVESEATTGFFVLLGTKGKKEMLEWCMKANLIASHYECPRCKKNMRLQERKGTVDGNEWRCRNQSKDNCHDVVRSVRKGTWFSESKLAITIILSLTRYWFAKSAKLGGVGEIVEIDESLFGKMKYGKGRRVNGKW